MKEMVASFSGCHFFVLAPQAAIRPLKCNTFFAGSVTNVTVEVLHL